MSEALDRILNDARDFSEKVEQCRHAASYNAADVRDAYGRLGRLRERCIKERDGHTLDPVEHQELRKVFEKDVFIKGMLDGRTISEHVYKRSRGGPVLVDSRTNSPIPLDVQTSAGALFARPIHTVHRHQGQDQSVNHLEQLQGADRRIKSAIARAMNKEPSS